MRAPHGGMPGHDEVLEAELAEQLAALGADEGSAAAAIDVMRDEGLPGAGGEGAT